MTLSVTHKKVATLPDQPGVEINKGEWNATHDIVGTLPASQVEAGGSDKSVQFNNAGALAGDSNFQYNTATGFATISNDGTTGTTQLEIRENVASATPDATSGINLVNVTAAAVNSQRISPTLVFEGQGWKTTATAASQSMKMQQYLIPVQGSTAPTANWVVGFSTNASAYTTRFFLTSVGNITLDGAYTSSVGSTTNSFISSTSAVTANFQTISAGVNSTSNASSFFAGASSITYYRTLFGGNSLSVVAGNAPYATVNIQATGLGLAASGNYQLLTQLNINPVTATRNGTSKINDTASVYVNGASTLTVTGKNYALWSAGGLNRFDGGMRMPIVAKTANYTATDNDYTILADATSGNITITLPLTAGQMFNVKKTDATANTVTIKTASGNIDGTAGTTGIVISTQYTNISIQMDGTNGWML